MNRKMLIVMGIVGALALGVLASDANAACPTAKQFTQAYLSNTRGLVFPADANKTIDGGVLLGRWWESGARAAKNEGFGSSEPCPELAWLEGDTPDTNVGGNAQKIYGFMAGGWNDNACQGVGCVSGPLVVLLQTLSNDGSKAYYAVGKALGTDAWDFGANSAIDWNLFEIPRPRVTLSSRGGSTVTLNLLFDGPLGARGESDNLAPETILTGYQLVRAVGTADPGRAQNLWTPLGNVIPMTAAGPTAAGVGVVCGDTTNDVFLATRLVLDNGQYLSDYVGASTRIECDPAVADPRFKMIDRTKSGRGTIRSNPR